MVKFNKIPILLVICVAVISLSFAIWLLFTGIDNDNTLIFGKIYKIDIYGTQGEGYVELTYDDEYISAFKKDDGTYLKANDFVLKISQMNNLSNDDSFTVELENAKELEKAGVTFDKISAKYKVSGLKIGVDFNVFADLKIYIDDESIVLDNSDCSNFVKDDVDFFIKNAKASYKEGDTVIVGAYVDMNAATDNGYKITITEKEYIIEEWESNQ